MTDAHLDPCPVGGFHAYRADTGRCACGAPGPDTIEVDPGPAAPPEFLADLLIEVRTARMLLATWPRSAELRQALDCLGTAAAAVHDAQTAMAGVKA